LAKDFTWSQQGLLLQMETWPTGGKALVGWMSGIG
jgi:hypothetical protein